MSSVRIRSPVPFLGCVAQLDQSASLRNWRLEDRSLSCPPFLARIAQLGLERSPPKREVASSSLAMSTILAFDWIGHVPRKRRAARTAAHEALPGGMLSMWQASGKSNSRRAVFGVCGK